MDCSKLRPGLFLAFLAAFGYAIDYVLIALVIDSVGSEIPTVVRYICQGFCCLPVLFTTTDWLDISWKNYFFMLFNGLILGILTALGLLSAKYISPMEVMSFFGTEPVFVLFLSRFFLKEKIYPLDYPFVAILFCGIVVVCQPEFIFGGAESSMYQNKPYGILLSLSSTFLLSVVDCMCRWMKTSNGLFLSLLQAIGAVFIILAIFGYRMTTVPTAYQWLIISLAGAGGVFARIAITFSMKYETPSVVSAIQSSEVIIATILQIIILNIHATFISIIGSFLVVTSIVLLSFRDVINEKLQIYLQIRKERIESQRLIA